MVGQGVAQGDGEMRFFAHCIAILAVATFIVGIGCTNQIQSKTIPSPQPPEPTPAPKPVVLPQDDASHPTPTEWWYYNGHLSTSEGEEFSFHFVMFQNYNAELDDTIEFGQAGITDLQTGEHINLNSDRFGNPSSLTDENNTAILNIDLGNVALAVRSDGSHVIAAETPDAEHPEFLSLTMEPPDTVMLHEGIGWMDWPFGWTYYYSYPRMEAEGVLSLDGKELVVSGEVWFDHQWGDFFVVGKPAGWQWFALHLDDGSSLMVSEVRSADGQVIAYDGTLIDPEGQQRILEEKQDGIHLEVLDHWISPNTRGEYPSHWRLRIDSLDFDVTMVPPVDDQEVPAMPYGNQAAAYWEGRVDIIDTQTGQKVGKAFAELSGYVDPEPLIWRTAAP